MSRPALLTLVLTTLAACGGTSGPGTGGGAGGSGGSSSSSSFCCSINGQSYDCPSQAAVDRCADLGNPDPSLCAQRSAACGGTGGGSGGGGGSTTTKKDVGGTCQGNLDCHSDVCIVRGGAQFGFCSTECDSFGDCPSFWDCEEVSNGSAKYCIRR